MLNGGCLSWVYRDFLWEEAHVVFWTLISFYGSEFSRMSHRFRLQHNPSFLRSMLRSHEEHTFKQFDNQLNISKFSFIFFWLARLWGHSPELGMPKGFRSLLKLERPNLLNNPSLISTFLCFLSPHPSPSLHISEGILCARQCSWHWGYINKANYLDSLWEYILVGRD